MAQTNERTKVRLFPTADLSDLLFFVTVNSNLPKNKLPVYGTRYRECLPHSKDDYPQHELVYITPADDTGYMKWYFAAVRDNQDIYNWSLGGGEQLVRGYLVRREHYFARSQAESEAVVPTIANEFVHPIVPTPDVRFPKYGFADDTVVEAPDELKSLYIVVQRRFIEPVTVDYQYNDSLNCTVSITKRLIPAGSQQPPPTSTPGITYEVQNGNVFHDILITQQIVLGDREYPYTLPTIPSTYNRQFPNKLESVEVVIAWAWAAQLSEPSAPESYSEDFYFKFKVTEPRPGPYSARVLRFITNNPDALRTTYPVLIVPQPVTESIGITSAWFYASPEGNQTSASAKEWSIPSTIHEEIEIPRGGNTAMRGEFFRTESLAATPSLGAFFSVTQEVMDYDVKLAPLGLFEVSVVIADLTNLYGA